MMTDSVSLHLMQKINREIYDRSGHQLVYEGVGNYVLRDKSNNDLRDIYVTDTIMLDSGLHVPNYVNDANLAFLLFGGASGWKLESAGARGNKITVYGFMNKQEFVGEDIALLICEAYLGECGINIWSDSFK